MPYTDSEMLDWLSKQHSISFERHYNGEMAKWDEAEKLTHGFNGAIDFFSIPSQWIRSCPNLREAISLAMQKELAMILKGDNTIWGEGLRARLTPDPGYPQQSYPRHFHS